MAIKAGWYKFNGVLTAPSQDLSVNIPFKIHIELSESVGMDEYLCSEIIVLPDGDNVTVKYVLTEGNIGNPEEGVEFPFEIIAYQDGWRTEYGYIDTIDVQADTDVSDKFAEWFAISTNPTVEPDVPDTTKVIKAGTYRFNDVLSFNEIHRDESLEFDLAYTFDASIDGQDFTVNCTKIKFQTEYYPDEEVVNHFYVRYFATMSDYALVYDDVDGWNTSTYGEGIKTITIPEDTEVSADFYAWFKQNAVVVSDEPNPDVPSKTETIKAGTYHFNDVLSEVETSNIVTMNFSMKTYISAIQVEVVADCSGMQLDATAQGGLDFNYVVESFSENLGVGFPYKMTVYSARNGYGWYHGEFGTGIQTITIPNDITVSSEFYAWFTANTKRLSTRLSTITYNGEVIAALTGGQKATLKCAGMTMESDVVVDVAEAQAQENVPIYDGVWEVTQWQSP